MHAFKPWPASVAQLFSCMSSVLSLLRIDLSVGVVSITQDTSMTASCSGCAVLLDLLELGFSGRHGKVERPF